MAVFQVYAPEKAVISRWILAICAVSLDLLGCYQLFNATPDSWHHAIGNWQPFGTFLTIGLAVVISTVLGIAGCYAIWKLVNYPRLIDFLQETEVEMTKVAWSNRKEVVGSSVVVVVTVVILGVWIFFVDFVLNRSWGDWIRAGFSKIFG